MTPRVSCWCRVSAVTGISVVAGAAVSRAAAAARRLSQTYATPATSTWAAKFANQTRASWPTSPALAMAPLAMMPTEENGERLPALAPLATISAVRNGETPTR